MAARARVHLEWLARIKTFGISLRNADAAGYWKYCMVIAWRYRPPTLNITSYTGRKVLWVSCDISDGGMSISAVPPRSCVQSQFVPCSAVNIAARFEIVSDREKFEWQNPLPRAALCGSIHTAPIGTSSASFNKRMGQPRQTSSLVRQWTPSALQTGFLPSSISKNLLFQPETCLRWPPSLSLWSLLPLWSRILLSPHRHL